MKKNVMTFARVFGLAALIAFSAVTVTSCSKTKGCKEVRDDKYDAAADEADATLCNETATTSKFAGNWTFTVSGSSSTYVVGVTAAADYKVSALTNFGLTSGGNPAAPVAVTLDVTKNQAVNTGSATIGTATVSNLVLTYNSATSATLKFTLAGTSFDGTYTDSGTK